MSSLCRLSTALLALALAGCVSNPLKGTLENRLVCSLDGREGYFVSKYAWIGISAEVAAADAAGMCAAARAAASAAAGSEAPAGAPAALR